MSNPPTLATTSTGSFLFGLLTLIASDTTHFFFSNASLVIVSDYLFSDSIQYDCYTESFRKEIGIINRKLAALADTVIECAYGNIIYHKNKTI